MSPSTSTWRPHRRYAACAELVDREPQLAECLIGGVEERRVAKVGERVAASSSRARHRPPPRRRRNRRAPRAPARGGSAGAPADRSSSSSATSMRYPPGTESARSATGPSALRRRETTICSAASGCCNVAAPQMPSMSACAGSARFASSSNSASNAALPRARRSQSGVPSTETPSAPKHPESNRACRRHYHTHPNSPLGSPRPASSRPGRLIVGSIIRALVNSGKPAERTQKTTRGTVSRRRSLSSQENDERLLEAALDEIAAVGVDGLGMSGVARRAGLTTGALYGRYENVNELAAAVWTARVRDAHFAFLDCRGPRPRRQRRSRSRSTDFAARARAPPPAPRSPRIELLATAHRIDELDEVVDPRRRGVVEGVGARRPEAHRRLRRAQVLFTIGSLWGVLLHAIPRERPADWERVFTDVGRSYARPTGRRSALASSPNPRGRYAPTSATPAQNALIDSVLAITARVGFERATASRIARRANLTSGAIYARYQTKDELLAHAIEVLLAQRLGRRSRSEHLSLHRARRRRGDRARRRRLPEPGPARLAHLPGGSADRGTAPSTDRGDCSTGCRRTPSARTSTRSAPATTRNADSSTAWRGSPRSSRSVSPSPTSSRRAYPAPTGATFSCRSSLQPPDGELGPPNQGRDSTRERTTGLEPATSTLATSRSTS